MFFVFCFCHKLSKPKVEVMPMPKITRFKYLLHAHVLNLYSEMPKNHTF